LQPISAKPKSGDEPGSTPDPAVKSQGIRPKSKFK